MSATLRLEGVTYDFGGRRALDGFSVSVQPGEVVALIGFNGAGKTTALRVLAGRLRPDAGIARVLGADPTRLAREQASRFGQVVDAPLIYPELTVRENVRCAALLHGLSSRLEDAVEAVLRRLDLGPYADTRARDLSAGNRQRAGIAAAVVHQPEALILDEPTSALDPRGVVIVRELVRDLAHERCGVLVSSHHLDEVSRVADRILVVHAGRMIGTLQTGGVDLEQRFFAMVWADDERRHCAASTSSRAVS